jgi:hypothetical protein
MAIYSLNQELGIFLTNIQLPNYVNYCLENIRVVHFVIKNSLLDWIS